MEANIVGHILCRVYTLKDVVVERSRKYESEGKLKMKE
jgi:hypothetical protein